VKPSTLLGLLLPCAILVACRDAGDGMTPPLSAAVPAGSASAPAFARSDAEATPPAPQAPPAESEVAPVASAAGAEGEDGEDSPKADADEPAADDGPLPDVEIKNVGMHIGGEANTADQKRPIRAEVAKHYDEMRRCYAMAEKTNKAATFGVDMRIDGGGGKPKVTNPRNGLEGKGVTDCLVSVFESIEFPPQPKNADRMVSFSVQFKKKS
jgi:hypothetical protein